MTIFHRLLPPGLRKILTRLESLLYGRVALQPFFESLHRVGLRGMGYMQSQNVNDTGEILALRHACQQIDLSSSVSIFDVGANNGQFLELALSVFPVGCSFFCFEPSAASFQILQNRFRNPCVRLFNLAISSRDAILPIYQSGSVFGTSYPLLGEQGVAECVRALRLDAFCASQCISEIFYLKVDVEGAEYDVLSGLGSLLDEGRVRFVQFEYGPNHLVSRHFLIDFFTLLSSYRIYRILRDGLRPLLYNELLEVPMTANFLAELVDF